jgi:LPXTG-site transpeptidase (sortase) family protein
MVLQGDGDDILGKAAGHVPASALPGGPGNVAIAGHRDSFFRALRNIRKDDQITFTTVEGTYYYQVASLEKVDPQHVQVLQPTGRPTLTLITCYPFNYIGPAPRRFVVQAAEIQPSQVSDLAPSVAEARPALDSRPAQHARPSRHPKAARLLATPGPSHPPARPLEASLVSSLPSSASVPAHLAPHATLAAIKESSAPAPAMAQAEQDDPPAGSPTAAHKKLGKLRAWFGSVSRHFREGDNE